MAIEKIRNTTDADCARHSRYNRYILPAFASPFAASVPIALQFTPGAVRRICTDRIIVSIRTGRTGRLAAAGGVQS